MSISVEYSSTRREVWGLYWRMWQQRLWKMHLLIFVAAAVAASFAAFGRLPRDVPELLAIVLTGLIPTALFALYPMLMFKPQMRVLTVDDDGIDTTIGKRKQSLGWVEIADVRSSGEALVIQRHNLNAFIVPARAFDTPEARSSFEAFVRTHAQAP
jgi:hypothetical protein